jgi:uncharacterized protein YgiM (DUF1202 family)
VVEKKSILLLFGIIFSLYGSAKSIEDVPNTAAAHNAVVVHLSNDPESYYGYLSVRQKPDPKSREIARLYNKDNVTVIRGYKSWYQIRLDDSGVTGWVAKHYIQKTTPKKNILALENTPLKPAPSVNTYNAIVTHLSNNPESYYGYLSVRQKPDYTSNEIDRLYNKDHVTILKQHMRWYQVKIAKNGKIGWVSKRYVTRTSSYSAAVRESIGHISYEDFSAPLSFTRSNKTYQRFGTSEIHGHVVYFSPTGRQIPVRNTNVYLLPVTKELDLWYRNYYLKNKDLGLQTIHAHYLNKTGLDIARNFDFYGVPAGKYYIVIEASHPVKKDKKIYIAKIVTIEKYKKLIGVFSKKL